MTWEAKIQLLKKVCDLLNKNNFSYLVYGSLGYWLLTGDENVSVRDVDIVIKHSDFSKLMGLLPNLSLNPIQTSDAIHANSLEFEGENGNPFDISFDPYEHYFIQNNIDLDNYKVIDLEEIPVKVMKVQDLIKVYKVGLKGDNKNKVEEYQNKINNLQILASQGVPLHA